MNETEQYLICTWHFIVFYENGELKQVDFRESKTGRVDLYYELNRLMKKGSIFKLYGVWHGEWRTDVFDLEPKVYLKRLEDYIKEENPKFKKF